jgi:hypothetical protein
VTGTIKQVQRTVGTKSGSSSEELHPIDELIPYNRRFLKLGQHGKSDSEISSSGIISKFGSNVKGIFSGFRPREMERPEVIRLRAIVGDLKDIKGTGPGSLMEIQTDFPAEAKTRKELLDEKRKDISKKAKEGKKDKNQIGLRIEIEKLKKKFPTDGNLTILDAILTCREGCLPHRSIEDRVASLASALRESGQVMSGNFLTTYAIDTVIDIYFLYLETLKKLFMERSKKLTGPGNNKSSIAAKSLNRDIKVLNILLNQSKLKKTINNVAQKLNGFGYPFVAMTNMHVSKTYSSDSSSDNEKIGPGTVKLNKFLIRIYMTVFSQIPIFQPLATRLCDALPFDYQCRIMVANVNIDTAYTQLKISKAMKAGTVSKQILALFLYGRQVVKATIKRNANTPAEAKILLRTAEMAEEYAFLNNQADPDVIKFGYHCASMALSFFKVESESIIRRLFEIADIKKVDLRSPSPEQR